MNTAPINHRDPIEYLINAMERAGQEDKPAEHGYGEKRLAVLAAIAALRAERDTAHAQVTRLTSELAFVRNEAEGFNAAWAFALERAEAERDVAVARTEQAERERDALMVRVDQWRQMADREVTAHVEMRAERDAARQEAAAEKANGLVLVDAVVGHSNHIKRLAAEVGQEAKRADAMQRSCEANYAEVVALRAALARLQGAAAMTARLYGAPLDVLIEHGAALVVRIGIETLAHATTWSDWSHRYDDATGDYIRNFAIVDAPQFAKDVIYEMLREREDGSTPLSDFIDKMTENAVNEGSEGLDEDFNHRIKHGEKSPLETW